MRSRSYLYPFIILLLVLLYYYYLKIAQIVILTYFRPLSNSILVKNGTLTRFQLKCDRPTDRSTDGRRDTPSYRDARTHLKTAAIFPFLPSAFSVSTSPSLSSCSPPPLFSASDVPIRFFSASIVFFSADSYTFKY